MGFEVNGSNRTGNTGGVPEGGSKTGNAHNVTVEECREMANDPSKSHISGEDFNKLSEDMKACYEKDPENGGYRLTQEVYDVLQKHSAEGSNNVE